MEEEDSRHNDRQPTFKGRDVSDSRRNHWEPTFQRLDVSDSRRNEVRILTRWTAGHSLLHLEYHQVQFGPRALTQVIVAFDDVVRSDGEFDVIQMTQRCVNESSKSGMVLAESYDTQLWLQEETMLWGKGDPILQPNAKPYLSCRTEHDLERAGSRILREREGERERERRGRMRERERMREKDSWCFERCDIQFLFHGSEIPFVRIQKPLRQWLTSRLGLIEKSIP